MSVVLITEPFSGGGSGSGTVTSVDVVGGTTGLTTGGGPVTTAGVITLSGILNIANGGTGQTTATAAINALLPSQTANAGKYLTTNGTNTSWSTVSAGTVTTVSVVSANGLAGTVANDSTTPAITLSTTITGVLKGNGTAISAAVANTDYQSPIVLTTTGSSGAATFNGTTLNIPQYTGGGGGGGPILESQIVVSQDYTISSNTNGFSVGPVTVAAGYAVTVPTGQVWAIWNT